MADSQRILIVMSNGILFGAYRAERERSARVHAETILGAVVIPCELFDGLPASVLDDLVISEYDESEDTPVVSIPLDHIKDSQ